MMEKLTRAMQFALEEFQAVERGLQSSALMSVRRITPGDPHWFVTIYKGGIGEGTVKALIKRGLVEENPSRPHWYRLVKREEQGS